MHEETGGWTIGGRDANTFRCERAVSREGGRAVELYADVDDAPSFVVVPADSTAPALVVAGPRPPPLPAIDVEAWIADEATSRTLVVVPGDPAGPYFGRRSWQDLPDE